MKFLCVEQEIVKFHFAVTFCKLTGKTVSSAVFQCFSFFTPFPGVYIFPPSPRFGVCEVQNF